MQRHNQPQTRAVRASTFHSLENYIAGPSGSSTPTGATRVPKLGKLNRYTPKVSSARVIVSLALADTTKIELIIKQASPATVSTGQRHVADANFN